MYFVFIFKTIHKSVSRANGEITWKEISILFSRNFLDSLRNIEKRLINTVASIQSRKKKMDFDDYVEYLMGISNKILLSQY